MRYTKAEKVDTIFIYGECRQIIRKAVRLYVEKFVNRVHSSFSVFLNIVQTFQETGSMDNKKRIKKATDDGNSTNILAAVALNPLVQDSLNVKMVLVDEVFCEYSIPTNFIPSISHFIENYMAMIFKIVYNSVNGHKDYKKIICLSLKSYLLTKLHLQTMDK